MGIKSNPWLLIDGNFMCHRAFHTTGMLLHEGRHTGTIFGVMKGIAALMAMFSSDHAIIAFDHGIPRRREVYPNYKYQRAGGTDKSENDEIIRRAFYCQVDMLKTDVLPRAGFKNVFFAEGFEADDIIAAVNQDVVGKKIVVSADKDLFQLIDQNTNFFNPISKKLWNVEAFKNYYGIHPSRWALVKAIAGCNSDNVEGIRGVGEKTAIRYLNKNLPIGSKKYLDIISKNGEEIKQRNLKLVKLPFEGLPRFKITVQRIENREWETVASEFGMSTLRGRYKRDGVSNDSYDDPSE